MSIVAAIYRPSGEVRGVVQTFDAARLNARLREGETWREVPAACLQPGTDVPPLETLPPHPELSEPG